MEIKGTLKQVHPVILRNEFKSRKVWLTTDGEYPQTVEIEVNGKSLDIFEGVSIGAPVICHINIRGREWKNKEGVTVVFNTLQCWKVQAGGASAASPVNTSITDGQEAPDLDEKLPF